MRLAVATAVEHFEARRYTEAIASFRAAYAIRPEPDLLYNIARSYERNGNVDDALTSYREFIAQPGSTAQLRAKALDNIDALQREKTSRAAKAFAPPPAPTPADPISVAPVVAKAPPPEKSHARQWVMIGAGGVAVITGAIFGVVAQSKQTDFDRATTVAAKEDAKSSGQTSALIADIGLFGGGAVAVAGLVWLLVDSGEEPAVALSPLFGADSVGMAVQGAW